MIVPHDPLDLLVVAFVAAYVIGFGVVYARQAIRRRRAWNQHGRTRPLHRRLGGPR